MGATDQGQGANTNTERTIVELLTRPKEGISTTFELAEALEGDVGKPGKTLTIIRRELQPEQAEATPRNPSKRRAHTFFAAAGFIDYLKKFGSESTVLFADSEQRCIQAVLDEEAEQGREVVKLTPQIHPRWQPWRDLLGQKLDLDAFRMFITNNRKAIVKPAGRELVFTLRQIRLSTDIQLQSGVMKKGLAAVNGLMIRSKITGGGDDESDMIELPESITIKTPILVDEETTTVEVDLLLSGNREGTEIRAQLSSADLREAEIVAFDVLVDRLRTELLTEEVEGRAFTVTHGRFDEDRWSLRGDLSNA